MRRWQLLLILSLLAGGAAAACGGGGTPAASVVRAAADRTAAAHTARIDFVLSTSMSGTLISGSGTFDFGLRRGTMREILSPGSTRQVGPITVVQEGLTVYERVPPSLVSTVGRAWLKIDLANLSPRVTGVDVSGLASAGAADPTFPVSYLRGAVDGSARRIGTDPLRGVKATHYTVVLDLLQAAGQLPLASREAVARTVHALGTSSVGADVWLDDQGRMRKFKYRVDLANVTVPTSPGTSAPRLSGTEDVSLDLWDFGVPVSVTIPPEDQTTDFASLLHPVGG